METVKFDFAIATSPHVYPTDFGQVAMAAHAYET